MSEDDASDIWAMQICERFGWTLADVQMMTTDDLAIVMGYMDGVSKLEQYHQQRRKK